MSVAPLLVRNSTVAAPFEHAPVAALVSSGRTSIPAHLNHEERRPRPNLLNSQFLEPTNQSIDDVVPAPGDMGATLEQGNRDRGNDLSCSIE